MVDPFSQILARLEMRHRLARQRNGFAGLRVATDARRTEMEGKAAEAPNLNSLPFRERIAHQVQQVLDRQLDILRRQVFLFAGNRFNEF